MQPALAEIVGSSLRRATTRITKTARTKQDSWADNPDDTFFSEEAVRALLEGMEIMTFNEEERTAKPTAAPNTGTCSTSSPASRPCQAHPHATAFVVTPDDLAGHRPPFATGSA